MILRFLVALLLLALVDNAAAQIPPGQAVVLYGKSPDGSYSPIVPNPPSSFSADLNPGAAMVAWGRNANGTYSPLVPDAGSGLTCAGCTLTDPTINGTIGGSAVLPGANGGTGVANTGKTITLGGSLTTSGAFDTTLNATGASNITLPTTGTLATLAGNEGLTNKTYNGNTWTAGTGTLTLGAGKTLLASNTLTLTATDGATLAIGAGGTLGSAAYVNTGTSGATVPLLNASNTFSAAQQATLTSAGATTVPFSVQNADGSANSEVCYDGNPSSAGIGVRSGQWCFSNNGGNVIAASLKLSNAAAPSSVLTATPTNVNIFPGITFGSLTALTVQGGELGIVKMADSGTAPGAAGLKLTVVCGTNAGTAKLIVRAGTSTSAITITDNIGGGVSGC